MTGVPDMMCQMSGIDISVNGWPDTMDLLVTGIMTPTPNGWSDTTNL
jgi:hypothetical protein